MTCSQAGPDTASMDEHSVEMVVTVTFSYTAHQDQYPTSQPRSMACLDREAFLEDSDVLIAAIDRYFDDLEVSVCPAVDAA